MGKFEHDFEIGFREVGKSNCLTNKGFLSYLEDAGGMHSNIAGYGLNDIEQTNLTWVVLYWKIRVFSRPTYGEKVHIKTWGRNSVKFYTYRDFELYNSSNTLIGIATSKWILLNFKNMEIEKLTNEIMDKYQPEDKKVFLSEPEINKIIIPKEYSFIYTYTVQRKDIDINNHMHNSSYLDLAYEVLPDDVYTNMDFHNFEIMYKKEIKLYDTIKCFYSFDDNFHYITIKSEDEKILHGIIKFSL